MQAEDYLPFFFQNKVFVYRGLEYERIGAFTQRLQTEFPQAQILMKSTTPDDSILNSDGQCILYNYIATEYIVFKVTLLAEKLKIV